MEPKEIAYYKQLVADHRGTSRQVGAGSNRSQQARFDVLVELLRGLLGERGFEQAVVLDFGCGKGDFAPVLARHRPSSGQSAYIGVDAIEENIEDARKLGPWDFRHRIWSGLGPIVEDPVDVVVFSGTLATVSPERRGVMLEAMFSQANLGVAGTLLTYSPTVAAYEAICNLTDPSEILRMVDRTRYKLQLRCDYLPHDFAFGAVRWPEPRG